MPEFVGAYDPITHRKVTVPAHFLGPRSPFPHLKPLPSDRDAARRARPTVRPTVDLTKPSGRSTFVPAKAAATDTKEK